MTKAKSLPNDTPAHRAINRLLTVVAKELGEKYANRAGFLLCNVILEYVGDRNHVEAAQAQDGDGA